MDIDSSRARLLEAAAAAFVAHGHDAVSMAQVRQAAGVSNGSLYHHFPTKRDLVGAVHAHALQSFHAALARALDRATDTESGVTGLVRAYVVWVCQNAGAARLLERLSPEEGAEADELARANAQALGRLAHWVQAAVSAGHLQDFPFAVWMALVFGPVRMLTPRWTATERPTVAPSLREGLAQAAWRAVSAGPAVPSGASRAAPGPIRARAR